jgi:hypothetical protein
MPVPTMLDVDDGLHLLLTERDLGLLQLSTVLYYLHESNPDNGLVRDKTDPKAPVSIAAVGMALATIPGVVERGVLFRDFAARGPLPRFRGQDHAEAPAVPARMSAEPEPDASGYKGFFCHFLDIETGRRVWQCELSTIDSAFLFAGAARRRSPGPSWNSKHFQSPGSERVPAILLQDPFRDPRRAPPSRSPRAP